MSYDIKKCENKCPKCGADGLEEDNIEWDHLENDLDIVENGKCKKCGCEFTQRFRYFVYLHTTY